MKRRSPINLKIQQCDKCHRWSSPDPGTGKTCRELGKSPTGHCSAFRPKGHAPTCSECKLLHHKTWNRTCFKNYGRRSDSPVCTGLSKNRRFTRRTRASFTDRHRPGIRDYVTGKPLDVVALKDGRGVLLRGKKGGLNFGLVVVLDSEGTFRVHPVEVEGGEIKLTETRDRSFNMGFAGEVFTVDGDGLLSTVGGQVSTVVVHSRKASEVWVGEEDTRARRHVPRATVRGILDGKVQMVPVSEPIAKTPHRASGMLGEAVTVALKMTAAGRSSEDVARIVAQRFGRARGLNSEEQAQLQERVLELASTV